MSATMIERIEELSDPTPSPPLERTSGNYWLIETLRRWGITSYAGVNGGGLIHVTKHLEPLSDISEARDGVPRMLSPRLRQNRRLRHNHRSRHQAGLQRDHRRQAP